MAAASQVLLSTKDVQVQADGVVLASVADDVDARVGGAVRVGAAGDVEATIGGGAEVVITSETNVYMADAVNLLATGVARCV